MRCRDIDRAWVVFPRKTIGLAFIPDDQSLIFHHGLNLWYQLLIARNFNVVLIPSGDHHLKKTIVFYRCKRSDGTLLRDRFSTGNNFAVSTRLKVHFTSSQCDQTQTEAEANEIFFHDNCLRNVK